MTDNSEIVVRTLEFPENIRTRPGMYIGAINEPTVILRELVDNFKDEGLMGFGSRGSVVTTDKYCIVGDDARGVPVYIRENGNTAAVDIWSSSHTGSKFDDDDKGTVVGMNGIGAKATNALSSVFIGYINLRKKDVNSDQYPVKDFIRAGAQMHQNPVYVVRFEKGYLLSEEVVDLSAVREEVLEMVKDIGDAWGTVVYFEPDPTIWTSTITNFNVDSLRISALQLDGKMRITINGNEATPYSLADRYYNHNLITVDDNKYFTIEGDASSEDESGQKTAMMYLVQVGYSGDDFDSRYDGSVNTLSTPSGVHVNAACRGFGRALSNISGSLNPSDSYYGIRLFSMIMTNRPVFNSQTKEYLSSVLQYNINDLSNSICESVMKRYADDTVFRTYIDIIIARIMEYKKQLGNLTITEAVSSEIVVSTDHRSSVAIGNKVKDCNTSDRSLAELFIVEGDSASGSLTQARDRAIHAVMPLRGKSLNATNTNIERLLENAEFKALFNVIGAGIHPYNVNMEYCRYGKVIIAADADADGAHIRALLIGAFGTHLPQLIEEGRLYVAETPLYEQDEKFFLSSERHLLDPNKHVVRNKGLGGMEPKDIAEFLFSDRRELIQVTTEGLEDALNLISSSDERYFMAVEQGLIEGEVNV